VKPPRRRAARRGTARAVLIPPREPCWVESDAYDRSAFASLVADSPSLAETTEAGGRLVPHFDALVEDVFCLLFKLEPRFRAAEDVSQTVPLNRALLDAFRDHPLLEHLRERTQLDEMEAGLATLLIAEDILALLRSEELVPRGDLLDLFELERREQELRRRGDELANAEEGEKGGAESAADAAALAEAQLRQKARQVTERLRDMPARARGALPAAAAGLSRKLAESNEESRSWGTGLGAGGRGSPGRQIELGRRLATNPKLRKLARLVGRMREQALALRRNPFERASEEVFEVRPGRDLERLLPPELVALRHPLRRREFTRRLVEGQLLTYGLRGAEEHGRGPMVVCLDGSSSMAGEKEIWSKAVALTLLEIARRQRRLFRFICFSSAETPLFTLDLNPRAHHEVQEDRALDLAEYFPGGGTDFMIPLDAALDCLRAARYRRGDVVLVTDGECRVEPAWLARFQTEKKKLGFAVYSVLIDVGGQSSRDTLAEISDRVTSVSTLTDDAARDLFLKV
jgi:uncharacterized protein with von Willebrand factor type A (vWA) domain